MEITIKLKNESELRRIIKILEREKINLIVESQNNKKKKMPNKKTYDTLKSTDKNKNLIVCEDVDDFFKKMEVVNRRKKKEKPPKIDIVGIWKNKFPENVSSVDIAKELRKRAWARY